MKILICFLFVSLINYNADAQLDTKFCDINTLPADTDKNLPVPDVAKTESYQAYVERNDFLRGVSEDTYEYFDGKGNRGVARTNIAQPPVVATSYCDYKNNELITNLNGTCRVTKLNETYQFLTPFYLVTVDGEEKIVSPLSFLFLSDKIQFVYTGSSNIIRGIPVNEWQTCVYNKASVQRFIYSFSDPQKWLPANTYNTKYDSVPVQVYIETKELAGNINMETYSISEFKPFLTTEEKYFYTPPGLYCPDRISYFQIPEMPPVFEITREIVLPKDEFSYSGYTITIREQYDFDYELFRFSVHNTTLNYIYDFKTGLNYKFDYTTDQCEVTKLTDTLKDENTYFDFRNVSYQYSGKRTVDGVNTDVWIGQRMFQGLNATFEWCFLADGWTRIDQVGDNAAITPILLTIYFGLDLVTGKQIQPHYHHFYNYHTTDEILLNHDISKCSNIAGKRRFSFSLPLLDSDAKQNLDGFRALFETATIRKLQQLAKVNVLRISELKIADDQDGVYILFTLFEKSSFYGDNANIEEDVSLEEAVNNLYKAFEKQIVIAFQLGDAMEMSFVTNAKSLNEIDANNPYGYIKITKLIYDQGYTSSDVAAITIMITLISLLVSILLLVLHRFNKIKLPFIN